MAAENADVRPVARDPERLVSGSLVIDVTEHTARVGEAPVDLTPTEFELLCRLAGQPGRIWTRRQLIDAVWGYDCVDPRLVTVHMGNLRRKLGQAALEPVTGAALVETVRGVGYRLVKRPEASHLDGSPATSTAKESTRPPFAGREPEMAALDEAATAVIEGAVRAVIIVGEAGIGKTRLAEEFALRSRPPGMRTYWGRCRETPTVAAYEPWVEILGELEREAPAGRFDLVLSPAPVGTVPYPAAGANARLRLFDRLADAIGRRARQGPICLIFDDLHEADTPTLLALQHLVRYLRGTPVMLMVTYRPAEAADDSALTGLVADMMRSDEALVLPLAPLTRHEVGLFLQRSACANNGPDMIDEVYQRTEGNPFLLTQLVRLLVLRSEPSGRPAGPLDITQEEGVRRVVLQHLARLSATTRQALEAASVIGREFTGPVLAATLDLDTESLPSLLDEAVDARVLLSTPEAPERYRFVHGAFQEVVYGEISSTDRAALHAKVGDVLERLHGDEADRYSAEIAHHFSAGASAGCAAAAKAVDFSIRAGRVAASQFAWEEACSQWRRALALLEAMPEGTPQRGWRLVCRVYEDLAEALGYLGELDEAIDASREAINRVPPEETVWHARLRREQAFWLDASGRRSQAETSLMEARALLGTPGDQRGTEWWQEWIDVHLERCLPPFYDADLDELQTVAAEVGEAVETHGTAKQRARLDLVRWLFDLRSRRFEATAQTIALAQRLHDSYLATGSPEELFAAEGALAMTFVLSPEHRADAWTHLSRHWERTRQTRDVARQLRALWALGVWYRLRGDVEGTRANALQTLAAVGDRHIVRYRARALGNLSWVAWRNGDLDEARRLATQGLAELHGVSPRCPFEWHVRWTLLALALADGDHAEAARHARAMLDPSQHKLPADLEELVHRLVDVHPPGMPEESTVEALRSAAMSHGFL